MFGRFAPRPKIACYKKVFANVKELQQELKARNQVEVWFDVAQNGKWGHLNGKNEGSKG